MSNNKEDRLMQVTTYETPVPQPIPMKFVNCYETYGVKIFVELDRKAKIATLVEWDDNKNSYKPKSWMFAERKIEFMDGWIAIFRACEQAIQSAKVELEKFDDAEMKKILDIHLALNKVDLSGEKQASKA